MVASASVVPRRYEQHPVARRGDLLGAALAAAADRRHAARERLDVGDAEGLVDARQRHQVAAGELARARRRGRAARASPPGRRTRPRAPRAAVARARRRSRPSAGRAPAARRSRARSATSACRLRGTTCPSVQTVGCSCLRRRGRRSARAQPDDAAVHRSAGERVGAARACPRCCRAPRPPTRSTSPMCARASAPETSGPCTSPPWTDTTSGLSCAAAHPRAAPPAGSA